MYPSWYGLVDRLADRWRGNLGTQGREEKRARERTSREPDVCQLSAFNSFVFCSFFVCETFRGVKQYRVESKSDLTILFRS